MNISPGACRNHLKIRPAPRPCIFWKQVTKVHKPGDSMLPFWMPETHYTTVSNSFWSSYPKKLRKKTAARAFNVRLKEGVDFEELIKARDNYVTLLQRDTWRSPMYPSTFLGPDERWKEFIDLNGSETDRLLREAEKTREKLGAIG